MQRTNEIGIRLALGGRPGQVHSMILRCCTESRPNDPLTLIGGMALVACPCRHVDSCVPRRKRSADGGIASRINYPGVDTNRDKLQQKWCIRHSLVQFSSELLQVPSIDPMKCLTRAKKRECNNFFIFRASTYGESDDDLFQPGSAIFCHVNTIMRAAAKFRSTFNCSH